MRLRDYAFVWLAGGSEFHRDVVKRALSEPWGFSDGDYTVLNSYIAQTFYKLYHDGLVLESSEVGFSAMNTGLVTPTYDDLYMCFEPNTVPGKQPWKYAGLCTRLDNEESALSGRLRNAFREMPRRAKYFEEITDVVFDSSKSVTPNWSHIVIENVDRLPLDFISSQLFDARSDVRELVGEIQYDPDRGSMDDPLGVHARGRSGEQYERLRKFLRSSPDHFNRIVDRLDGARRRAEKRAEYSFRTGVPSFYPTIDAIQMLLPLCLSDESRPDVVLVLGTDKWGNYEGRTILTVRMAYNNARLLCRPESEWLRI